MRVLMLGWEFPPFISGGLGTACFGLTKALSRQNVEVLFVLPQPVDSSYTSHVKLLSPKPIPYAYENQSLTDILDEENLQRPGQITRHEAVLLPTGRGGMAHVRLRSVDVRPPGAYSSAATTMNRPRQNKAVRRIDPITGQPLPETGESHRSLSVLRDANASGQTYQGDLMTESRRYADLCMDLAADETFDVIHAHDWMTFPAGLAVAGMTGKPLVVHVHSTEFDRSGDNVYQPVYDIERRGMQGACRVIAVSHMTRTIIEHRYGVDAKKIDVVYNGIEKPEHGRDPFDARAAISRKDKIVLFLGRITMQKGPEYFVCAAKKVLEKYDKVKFVIAGTGDKIRDIIELAAEQGIGHKVLFTGFLHKADVERIFKMADVYVMPSVSEPFGIAPLEAISHDVPVIISRTSGVAEVLTHALKVDFWDTHEIANKIIAVLRYPPLSSTLRQHADMEVRRLTWSGAATLCQDVYRKAMEMIPC
jgi:glycosyltransferase involved in cell wall biosynthesis